MVRGLSRGLSKGTRRLLGERGARGIWTGTEDLSQVKDRFEPCVKLYLPG